MNLIGFLSATGGQLGGHTAHKDRDFAAQPTCTGVRAESMKYCDFLDLSHGAIAHILSHWDGGRNLWLTPDRPELVGISSRARAPQDARQAARRGDRQRKRTGDARHERARAVAGNFRLLPATPAWPNRPSAGARSTTASSPAGCATAAASPPRRSTASAASWRPTATPPARPAVIARRMRERRRTEPDRSPAARRLGHARRRSGRRAGGRSAAQLPLLRQPAEVPAVRQHLLRKMGGGAPRLARACQHPSAPAGAAPVRRRRRRRHRAAARDARDARPLPAHAVLRRRQGDQPRGRAPRHAEDVGPLHRASGDRAGADQPRLCRRALARGEVAVGGLQHGLARGGADRLLGAPVRAADHRPGAVPQRELEGRRERRRPATRCTSGRSCWWSIARTTSSCSIRSSRGPAAPSPTTIWSSPRSPIARAPRSTSRPSA